MLRRISVAWLALGIGCGPTASPPDQDDASTTAAHGSSTASTPGTDTGPLPSTTSGLATETADDTASSGTDTTGPQPGEGETCNYVLQDCAAGLKCVRLDIHGTGEKHETVCVAVVDDPLPVGEVCAVDPRTGQDDCSIDTFCAPFFPPSGTGVCTHFCAPIPGALACDAPDEACILAADLEYGCFPVCDPLTSVCPTGHACSPHHAAGFVCVPTNPTNMGTTGDPCYAPTEGCPRGGSCYQCENGTTCTHWLDYGPGCDPDNVVDCCTEYCDTSGGTCSNPLHECVPSFAPGSNVGLCGIPEDFDWCDGSIVPPSGLCPPADAEPSYPWCSTLDDSACLEGSVNLGGGQCGFCWCSDTCASVAECPVPTTGTAELVCDPAVGCSLLCDQDSDCPNGMDCHSYSGELRCLWRPEEC